MGLISLSLPVVGNQNYTEDPKVTTALSTIQTLVNGSLDNTNLSGSAAIKNSQLAGFSAGFTNISTSESRTNTAYGTLPTPDQVTVTLPSDGLMQVYFQGTWQESVGGAGRAAIFIGSNQLVVQGDNSSSRAPLTQAARTGGGTAAYNVPLVSFAGGLLTVNETTGSFSSDATTGQVVGVASISGGATASFDVGGTFYGPTGSGYIFGGPCAVFAAAGTYTVSIQFKSASGSVTASNRRLWVTTVPFS